MKVMTIVGTRPEIIRLARVMARLDEHTEHVLVHTGQNYDYELNEIFFQQLELKAPKHYLESAGANVAETIGNIIAKVDRVLEAESPDAVLVLGDTNSCLAAIAAKRRKIPIFHMEAGNRSFDERVPEETNRRIIDHISDINLAYTEHARQYLLREGLRPETVFVTGSPLAEVLGHYLPKIEASKVMEEMGLKVSDFFLVSAHREENVDDPRRLADLVETLEALVTKYGKRVIVSTHPRTRSRLDAIGALGKKSKIEFLKPLGFLEYVKLQRNAFCVVSDSGSITEESSILNFPAVTIREAHERPEGMDEGVLVMCGLKAPRVLEAIEVVTSTFKPGQRTLAQVRDYTSTTVSHKVLRIILSYVDYVNRTVWRK